MLTSFENDIIEKRARTQFTRDIIVAKTFLNNLGGQISQAEAIKQIKKYDSKLKRMELIFKPFMRTKQSNNSVNKVGLIKQITNKYIELYDVYSFMCKFMFGLETFKLEASDFDNANLSEIYNIYFKTDYINHQQYMYENKDKQILSGKLLKEYTETAVNEN